MRLASMTAWIWGGDPAVMFEMVQHASFLIPSLGEERRERMAGRAPDVITTCVWRLSPVVMFPIERAEPVFGQTRMGA